MGQCKNILVNADECSASVDSIMLTTAYQSAGISVWINHDFIHINMPYCNVSSHLVMYVYCQEYAMYDGDTGEDFIASTLKLVVVHGLSHIENSHGLIGETIMNEVLYMLSTNVVLFLEILKEAIGFCGKMIFFSRTSLMRKA